MLGRLLTCCLALLMLTCAGFAQRNEVAVTGGGYFPSEPQTSANVVGVVEGTFAHRIFAVPLASVYIEVPVAHAFGIGLRTSGEYNATFMMPGVKVKLAPAFFASPYLAAGLGVAYFGTSGAPVNGSNTSAAFDVGGGVDVKVFPFVSLRGEIRNANSGGLGGVGAGRQNNILATGGLVLRF